MYTERNLVKKNTQWEGILKTFFIIITVREAAPKSQERFLAPDNLYFRLCISKRFYAGESPLLSRSGGEKGLR